MREILFRGKRTKTGEWVIGLLWHHTEKASSIYSYELDSHVWVHPETVGQYTGLTDKNGKRIFEGDIVKWDELEWGCPHCEIVEWDHSLFAARKHDWKEWCEAIGNIHDNPELLEVS